MIRLMPWITCFRCMFNGLNCNIDRYQMKPYFVPEYLCSGVSANILNEKKQSPIHLATEMNKVTALKVMGSYRNIIDIQKGGEHGRTALHLAAIYDHEECARILVRWVK